MLCHVEVDRRLDVSFKMPCLTVARGIALWTALIASMPRVGCTCADGTILPTCVTAAVNLFADEREADSCCCCKECGTCGDSEDVESERSNCPVSGLPCQGVLTSASPTTLVDVVDPPSPLLCDELVVIAKDYRLHVNVSWSPHIRSDHRPLSALVELGQLLRV